MPGDGSADDIGVTYKLGGYRYVDVFVGNSRWHTFYDNGWQGWYRGGCLELGAIC